MIKYRFQAIFLLIGLTLIGLGILFLKNYGSNYSSSKIEVLESTTEDREGQIIVEVAGAVETPGVYRLSVDARVEDALIAAGGIAADANREWMEKMINRAARVTDGQKIYIARQSDDASAKNLTASSANSDTIGLSDSSVVNVNTASQKELESLPEIGQVRGQSIIEHRPYSNLDELVSKGAITSGIYEKIKDKITVY